MPSQTCIVCSYVWIGREGSACPQCSRRSEAMRQQEKQPPPVVAKEDIYQVTTHTTWQFQELNGKERRNFQSRTFRMRRQLSSSGDAWLVFAEGRPYGLPEVSLRKWTNEPAGSELLVEIKKEGIVPEDE